MEIKSLPLLIAAGVGVLTFGSLLVWVIARLLRSNRQQLVAAGPFTREQEFELSQALTILLMVEVPRFGSDFRNLQFQVVEKATGQATNLRYSIGRGSGAVYGLTTMRVPIGRAVIQQPGSYLVRIDGLQAESDYSNSRLLLSRPYLGRMVLQIIGIVICAIGFLVSLLLGLWQVLPLQQG